MRALCGVQTGTIRGYVTRVGMRCLDRNGNIHLKTRAENIITNCRTYLLTGRGHMSFLTEEEKKMMVDFFL